MRKILERIMAGEGSLRDLDLLQEIAGSMGIIPGTTICGLSDGAAWPVKNAITKLTGQLSDWVNVDKLKEALAPAKEKLATA